MGKPDTVKMKIKGYIFGTLASAIWGSVFFVGRVVMENGDVHPFVISLLRCFFASIFLLAVMGKRSNQVAEALKKDWKIFLFLSFTGIFIFNILVFASLMYTTATSSSILMNANPIFIVLIASCMLKEKISSSKILGVILGFAGCVMVILGTGRSDPARMAGLLKGNILALAGSLCWAVYTVAGKYPTEKYGAILTTFITFTFGFLFFLVTNTLMGIPVSGTGFPVLLAGAYLGIIPAGVGYTLWYHSLRYIEAGKLGILQYVTPVTTALLSAAFLRESFTLFMAAGMAVIFLSIYISDPSLRISRRSRNQLSG